MTILGFRQRAEQGLRSPSKFNPFHCGKIVRIRSYSGPDFPAFELNTERYSVSLRIQSECREMQTIITPNKDIFYAMFQSNVAISYPLKILENLQFSDVFRGYKMETLAQNRPITYGFDTQPLKLIKSYLMNR